MQSNDEEPSVLFVCSFGAVFPFLSTVILIYLHIRHAILRFKTSVDIPNILNFYMLIEIINGYVAFFNLIHCCIVYNVNGPIVYVAPLLFWDTSLQHITILFRSIAILILEPERLCSYYCNIFLKTLGLL